MKKLTSTLLYSMLHFLVFAQQKNYDVKLIPSSLLKNANSVVREDNMYFEVKDIDAAIENIYYAVTLLNENAKDELDFYQFSDKFHVLEDVLIKMYDESGRQIKKYDKDDLTKQAAGEGLVPDGKVYYIHLPNSTYPVTLEFEYNIKHKGLLNYPSFVINEPQQSVQNSSFTVSVPSSLDLRYKQKNCSLQPKISTTEKNKVYEWIAANIPAAEIEKGAPISANSSKILIAPNKFKLDDYEGDMATWSDFGKWYANLSNNTGNLKQERKDFFIDLVKTAKTDKEKIATLYKYLQNNFRYVSIQLGIGGFKPFAASFVDEKKYGDCKALSNYMQSCLAAVGIKSYQALINARYNDEPVMEDFPINGFNHVILCVPQQKDSIWLECTSNTNDFAVLGSFTENKKALIITENGGVLVNTPKSNAQENILAIYNDVMFNADGTGKIQSNIKISGEYKQDFINYIHNQKSDDQKRYLMEGLGYVEPYDFNVEYNKENTAKINFDIEKMYEFNAGNKYFVSPRYFRIWKHTLPTSKNRTKDFLFEHPLTKIDSTVINLDKTFKVEALPKDKNIQFVYGSFSTTYKYIEVENKLITTAKLILSKHRIPAENYKETEMFFEQVLSEFDDKIVLAKK